MSAISGLVMEGVISIRNIPMPKESFARVVQLVLTELSMIVILVIAVLESLVYALGLLPNMLYLHFSESNQKNWCLLHLQSSLFVVFWIFVDAICCNFCSEKLYESEEEARKHYIVWSSTPKPREVVESLPMIGLFESDSGVEFMKENVLQEICSVDLEALENFDTKVYEFVMARAIYIFCFGAKKEAKGSNYFQEETILEIQKMRAGFVDDTIKNEIWDKLKTHHQYSHGELLSAAATKVFTQIQRGAKREELLSPLVRQALRTIVICKLIGQQQ